MSEKPKIAIIEAFWHHDVLNTMYEIGESLSDIYDITVIASRGVIEKSKFAYSDKLNLIIIKNSYRYTWSKEKRKLLHYPKLFLKLQEEGENLQYEVKKLNPDVIIINTLTEPPFFHPLLEWGWRSNKKFVIIIHNAHFWNLLWFIHSLNLRNIKERKFLDLLYNLYVSKRISGFITLGEYVKIPPSLKNKPHIVIPSRIGRDIKPVKSKKSVYFVVPGKVIQKYGKDYLHIIDSFHNAIDKNPSLRTKAKLILLGRMMDDDIKHRIEKIDPNGEIIIRFKEFVDEKIFEKWLLKAHFVILPDSANAVYGTYKISGAINDAISYGVPILIPKSYAPHYNFRENVIRYTKDSLQSVITSCTMCVLNNYPKYNALLNTALNIMRENSVKNVSKNMVNFIKRIISDYRP
ncbi:hypothetical protein [Candidatus Aciduliprofundum boonei]|uniref:Uncharacterized protein n=1 Tax=Aciduliprofundum boonei (strain DSM 19572 / T469) TaxID=439481 RepID=B5I9K9_ACIB4|nr:hypothetical protein [Candidatus Aciduliprofundum boonei]ADD08520.1 hypothetical protein Aboo_0709 [Aciduliprofundum boonei T469]EDY37116.1 hypothetical protein ABOONEI_2037 [Aciduliprofundum boonei T469]HII54599.1 glycosyltransferase family 4 protein [Candidatus Aciduliprofundum boonei]